MLRRLAVPLFLLLLMFGLSTVHAQEACPGGYAPTFRLEGLVTNKKTFTLESLQQFTPSKVVVSFFSGSQGLVTKTYLGVLLSDLLNEAEVILDPSHKNDSLRKYLAITATDCYQVIVALAELLPTFGGQQVLIAYADGDGNPLTDEGMARLVVPGDKAGGRFVSNIVSIVVRSTH